MLPPRVPLLPVELQQQVQAELRPGEKQVWAGRPLPRVFRGQAIVACLFGLPFAGAGLFVELHAGRQVVARLFGLPFLAVGCSLITAPWWMAKKAKRTVYAVTDQRAVVITGNVFGGVTVQSFEPDRLTGITRNQRADGTGDLVFEQFTQRQGTGTTTVRRGFMGIDDVRQVEELIHATLLAGRTRPA